MSGPPPEPILPAVPEERAGPLYTSYLQFPQLPEGQSKAAVSPQISVLANETKARALTTKHCYTS